MDDSDKWRVVAANVIAKTWRDPDYKRTVLSDPKGALADAGLSLPGDLQVKALENTSTLKHLVLPPADKIGDADKAGAALMSAISPLPAGVAVQIHQDSDAAHHFVLPVAPQTDGTQAMTDEHAAQAMASAFEAVNVATSANVAGEVNAAGVTNVGGAVEGVVVAVGAAVLT